jgi:hypothetical protein
MASVPDRSGGTYYRPATSAVGAELECLHRLRAIRDVCDAFLGGHWRVDSGVLLAAVELLDQAGAWAMTAEQAFLSEVGAA